MTIKVGDKVNIRHSCSESFGDMEYTVLAIQDCGYDYPPEERKWAVVAFKSDMPHVHNLYNVRKVSEIEEVTVGGILLDDGSIIAGIVGLNSAYQRRVTITYTKVEGKIDLTKPYTVKDGGSFNFE